MTNNFNQNGFYSCYFYDIYFNAGKKSYPCGSFIVEYLFADDGWHWDFHHFLDTEKIEKVAERISKRFKNTKSGELVIDNPCNEYCYRTSENFTIGKIEIKGAYDYKAYIDEDLFVEATNEIFDNFRAEAGYED